MSEPTIGQAWSSLHFTVLRTCRHTTVPLSSEVFQLMVGELISAWQTADKLTGSAPLEDIDALRVACMWHFTCVVKTALSDRAATNPGDHMMSELRALWHWTTALEAKWNLEASDLLARVQKLPSYAAEGAGVLPAASRLAGEATMSFVSGGDA